MNKYTETCKQLVKKNKKKNSRCTCAASKCVNALPQIHYHPDKTEPVHIPLCSCAGSSSWLTWNHWVVGQRVSPDPLYSWVCVTCTPTDGLCPRVSQMRSRAELWCYYPTLSLPFAILHLQAQAAVCLSVAEGWRLISVLWLAVLLFECVYSSVRTHQKQCECMLRGVCFFPFKTGIIANAVTCSPVEALGSADYFISMHSINHSQQRLMLYMYCIHLPWNPRSTNTLTHP